MNKVVPFSQPIGVLVVGDWLVDEHWVVGKHRAPFSSRTGRDHTRALHGDRCSVRSLCGAGQVATILYQASCSRLQPFQVSGMGIWHPDDTVELAAMLDPQSNVGKTPHRLHIDMPPPKETVRLFNLAQESAKLGVTAGTTRVIRIYENTGDKPDLKQRVDWELPLSGEDFRKIRGTQNLDTVLSSARSADIKHIVIKDLRKGVVCIELIEWLKRVFPTAKWHVSSKEWKPAWLNELPEDSVELIVIPQLAAKMAITRGDLSSSSWITLGGEPSADALRIMNGMAESFRNARIVVLPEGMRVLAQDSIPNKKKLFVQPSPGAADLLPFTPMASVLFPALLANLALQTSESRRDFRFGEVLKLVNSFTEKWEKAEARRLTQTDDWQPTADQTLRLTNVPEGDKKDGAWHTFDWQDVNEAWTSAFAKFGIVEVQDTSARKVKKEFHLWRGMTEIDGYIACIPSKRAGLLKLLHQGRALVRANADERRQRSFMIVDSPGSGKTFLVECLAKTLGIDYRTFNITQMTTRNDVADCFHSISAAQSENANAPLIVFIDEINAKVNGQHVYDAFLGPLEDGTYVHSGKTFRLSPCLWIFAGTEQPTRAAGGAHPSDKAEDFESRLTLPVLRLIDRGTLTEDEFARFQAVERIYIGVATIRAIYPDVKKISERVLEAFQAIPDDTGPRGIKRFVRSFEYIQYGKVTKANLPRDWHKLMTIKPQLFQHWDEAKEDDTSLVEIRSQQSGYSINRIAEYQQEKRSSPRVGA